MSNGRRVLVVAPHPDDESIGCGGTIALHVSRGDEVSVVFLTSGEKGLKAMPKESAWTIRETEAHSARHILGISDLIFLRLPDLHIADQINEAAAALRPVILDKLPHAVYLPHPWDYHPDHHATLPVLRAALENNGFPKPPLLFYEIWSPLHNYCHVEDITAVITRKMRAIRCYRSQLDGFRYDRATRGLNQYRGITAARTGYAEVFDLEPGSPMGGC